MLEVQHATQGLLLHKTKLLQVTRGRSAAKSKAKPDIKPTTGKKKSAAVLVSSQSEAEDSEEASDSEDELRGLQIEKVLDGRPSAADAKQQEYLVKFQGK